MKAEESLIEALMKKYGLNAEDADSVLAYATTLSGQDKSAQTSNDYAVAKMLNETIYVNYCQ
jgi:hypothetical protein